MSGEHKMININSYDKEAQEAQLSFEEELAKFDSLIAEVRKQRLEMEALIESSSEIQVPLFNNPFMDEEARTRIEARMDYYYAS